MNSLIILAVGPRNSEGNSHRMARPSPGTICSAFAARWKFSTHDRVNREHGIYPIGVSGLTNTPKKQILNRHERGVIHGGGRSAHRG